MVVRLQIVTRAQRVSRWVGGTVSFVATGYAVLSVVFYSWLNAAEPDRWPSDRAAIWVYSSLAGAAVFATIVVVCVVLLVRDVNRRNARNAEDLV